VRAANQLTPALFDQRKDILFVGAYNHPPNIDAARFLAHEIMPLLRVSGLGINLILAGSNPTDLITSLQADDIKVVGYVEKLEPLLNCSRIMVAPLRYGAGIKGKVGSAMMAGLPVVASSLAAEGMGVISNEHVIIADGADAIAQAILDLYSNKILWSSLRSGGYEFAKKEWGIENGYKNFSGLTKKLGIDPTISPYEYSCYNED
jgi:glycosyltransferase involved in cell wall biosynthesis